MIKHNNIPVEQPRRVFDLAYRQLTLFPELSMFAYKQAALWQHVTTSAFIEQTRAISKGLLQLGVKIGDKVGLVAESRYEWHVIDFAIQQIGAVTVAMYPNITDADYQFIFNDAEIALCIVSDKGLYKRICDLKDSIYSLKYIFAINEFPEARPWTALAELGQQCPDETLDNLRNAVSGDDLATLIYTSGTTGKPKGVMLTHGNLLSSVFAAREATPLTANARALTFLPPCHAYERMVIYTYFYIGITVYIAEGLERIADNIREVKPHIMTAVPRIMEKVFENIMKTGATLSGIKKKLFDWAIGIAEQFDPTGANNGFLYRQKLAIARRLVLNKFHQALGGHLVTVVSGSASLQSRIIRVLLAARIPIYEGYGLTEASPLLTVNFYDKGIRVGTVGNAVKDVEIKMADDGEILVKGPNIMQGYYKNPEATSEVLKDGWLYTGDIGKWVDGNFLKIIDRKKEMFKISGGKYIVPQPIETKLVESNFIEQAMVVGDSMKYAGAFIVPNYANLKDWAKQHEPALVNLAKEQFLKAPAVYKRVNQEVKLANRHFGNWEQIKKIAILPEEFTIERGELTPTLKMKRREIMKRYQAEYTEMYS
ncbi:long-chain fatty acid--CoA ligase [Sphingobacterium oryzagri]|uniref:Long-chain fatty acid--CoA ligase n=1 Tax=Sphingobacterium oryzagri TaxID=3025669 RepID=A0ABY7WKD7_9SPHI|nr:long-chain fatty acid--CoA ligase [Sphingobacterium sp. KACC 22765]WDF67829.1 long-chain fatty acid--CoA ligase [Sphingobacterium sp. KACC 22765]